jgi:hypothetical protein
MEVINMSAATLTPQRSFNMNKFFKCKIACEIVVFLLLTTLIACSGKNCNSEKDFKVELVDGGNSIEISEYVGEKKEVNIPPKIQKLPVTRIGTEAFNGENITSITIPDSVTFIGERAFFNNKLTSVTIPDSVTTVRVRAFAGNQLISVTIGANISTDYLFVFDGFEEAYNASGKASGTYTRSDTSSKTWTKK